MIPTPLPLVDQAARLLWKACVQFGLFGTVLLIPLGIAHRRPAARHFLASAALVAALVSPVTAGCSDRLGLDWIPVPTWLWLLLADEPAVPAPAIVDDRGRPAASPDPPLRAASSPPQESDRPSTESRPARVAPDGRRLILPPAMPSSQGPSLRRPRRRRRRPLSLRPALAHAAPGTTVRRRRPRRS